MHEGAAMWVPPFFVKSDLATTLNIHLFAPAIITPAVALKNTIETIIKRKLQRSYLEDVKYYFMKFTKDDTIAEMNSKFLRYTQLAHMTSIQYAGALFAKSRNVADVYDVSALNDIFIEGVVPSICYSLYQYSTMHAMADVADIVFNAQSL